LNTETKTAQLQDDVSEMLTSARGIHGDEFANVAAVLFEVESLRGLVHSLASRMPGTASGSTKFTVDFVVESIVSGVLTTLPENLREEAQRLAHGMSEKQARLHAAIVAEVKRQS
jgi:hypothetical protein